HRDDRRRHSDTSRRTVLGRRTFRHVHMDVDLVERRRLDAEGRRLGAHIGARRVYRFLHHIAELAGRLHAAFAGQHDRFDLQGLAAHFGPGQAGDHTDLIFAFHLAVAEFPHAGIGSEVFRTDFDRLRLIRDDFLHGLARQVCDLAFEIANARFTGVIADEVAQTRIGDLPFAFAKAMRLDLFRDQVTLGNLDFLILGVTRDADDLHAVHQRLRHAQAVG